MGQFSTAVDSIRDRNVMFTGNGFEDLEKNYLLALNQYKDEPSSYPEKDSEATIIDRFSAHRSRFRDFLTVEEINDLKTIRFDEHFHPTYAAIYNFEQGASSGGSKAPFQIAYNTDNCMKWIAAHKPEIIQGLKARLLDTTDFSNASGAIAEIRAFGSLGFARLAPSILPTRAKEGIEVADFSLNLNGQEALVEVHTRISGKQHERVIDWQDEPTRNVRIESIRDIAPFGHGNPEKKNDGITTNVISKICATKQSEGQFRDDTINILWIDLQDAKTMPFSCGEEHCLPYFTYSQPDNKPFTGVFWHAFYGMKNEKVLEVVGTLGFEVQSMMHDGRFIGKSKLNFAVISLPERIIVFENPKRAQMKSAEIIRTRLHLMPEFSSEFSLLELQPGYLEVKLAQQRAARDFCYKSFIANLEPIEIPKGVDDFLL